MRTAIVTLLVSAMLFSAAEAQELILSTDNTVYGPGQPLFVYGNTLPDESLIVRFFTPDGTISKFDQIRSEKDGSFDHMLLIWPTPSANFPYGTYTVEVISTTQDGISTIVDVTFASDSEIADIPVERELNTLVFVPETAGVNVPLRVFIQTTSDGLLVGSSPESLLATTHVHLPSGDVKSISESFETLHRGLFYVDYTPRQLGTYVFHAVAFHQGTVSHSSAATNVQSSDIGGISAQIVRLNTILNETSAELDRLKSEVSEFGSTLDAASSNIDTSVTLISESVGNIEDASIQLNSLLFPVVTSIGIIVALQIVILARRR